MAAVTKASQDAIDQFWDDSITIASISRASTVLPPSVYTKLVGSQVPKGTTAAEIVDASYEIAKKDCEKKVAQIVKECMMVNRKYSDPYFDLNDRAYCICPLRARDDDAPKVEGTGYDITTDAGRAGHLLMFATPQPAPPTTLNPPSVKRVCDIFDDPQFFIDGASAKDIRQGREGDCWFLSALSTICNLEPTQHLINKICVARDQDVGVYGFVLYRDGEWTSVIIDDKLYLREPDYEFTDKETQNTWEENRIRVNSAEEYRKEFQSNSRSLYYAQSADPNETWVPLIEKAFAKAHGDYGSISGGSVGEGVEDLTGGISTELSPSDILNRTRFWNESLLKVNEEYLFGCGTPDWEDPLQLGRDGIYGGHAYSILRAVNYGQERLVLMKNPWGESEWNGPWSDGSSQWNSESIKALDHTFGNDGVFWIRYEDMLRKYATIYMTRLFKADWKVTQQWICLAVPWAGEYQDTKFEVAITKDGPTVFVLSKLDERYFKGLTGQYRFALSFRIHRAGEEEYVMRTFRGVQLNRSVSCDVTLEAGSYEVRIKIIAVRDDAADTVEQVLKDNWLDRRDKLLQVGQAYDLAHAKAQLLEEEKPQEAKPKKSVPVAKESKPTEQIEPVGPAASEVDKVEPVESKDGEEKGEGSLNDLESKDAENTGDEKDSRRATSREVAEQTGEGSGRREVEAEEDEEMERGEERYSYPEGGKPPSLDGRPAAAELGKLDAPWSAVAVIGLRVYCEEGDASVKIVRPKPPVKAKEEQDPLKLDVDDPARDATKGEDEKKEEKREVEEERIEDEKKDDAKVEEEKKEELEEDKEGKEKSPDNTKEEKNDQDVHEAAIVVGEKKNGSSSRDSDEYVKIKHDDPNLTVT